MKKLNVILVSVVSLFALSCGGGQKQSDNADVVTESPAEAAETSASDNSYDPKKGLGKFDESNVDVSSFNASMAAEGQKIAEVKCTSCHKMTEEKLVGPGWKGVTDKHTPYWIMNFITNPDPMIDKDPELQKQLEICMVRMPNQGLSDEDARKILEYMRQINGAK
ncbi:c-type cytochrome [Riemerella columbipharyngis]|uniref:Cytochrome c n=1 Tax=Riemerella columbipharyngis TaxID=1071918 RepID=A0A1G7C693_9FLAO|nr:cytochrome c [Riemerella columbipharyngis]SDE34904.1 Cytochrome c [Riemerella columbipharyngis]